MRQPTPRASSRSPSPPPPPLYRRPRPLGLGERAREIRRVCARVVTCVAVVRLHVAAAVAAPPGPRALVAHDSPRPVCRVDTGCTVIVGPPLCADRAGCGGRCGARTRPESARIASTCAQRRLARAVPLTPAWAACVGRAGAPSKASGAVGGAPCERRSRTYGWCYLAGARSAPLGGLAGPRRVQLG